MHGPNAKFSIGANPYGTVEDWTLDWQYDIIKAPVSNSQIKLYAASNFDGNFTADAVLPTDNDWLSGFLGITNGDLTATTFTLVYKDISGTSKTTTCQGRFHKLTQKMSKGEFCKYSVKCELSAVPTGF